MKFQSWIRNNYIRCRNIENKVQVGSRQKRDKKFLTIYNIRIAELRRNTSIGIKMFPPHFTKSFMRIVRLRVHQQHDQAVTRK